MDTERFCTLDFLLGQTDSAPLQRTVPCAPPALPRHISALTGKIEIKPDMTFREASERWLSSLVSRRDTTSDSYQQYVRALELFFANMTLRDIRLDHITAYQKARFAGAEPFIRYRRPQDAKARHVGDTIIPAKGRYPMPGKAQEGESRAWGFNPHPETHGSMDRAAFRSVSAASRGYCGNTACSDP